MAKIRPVWLPGAIEWLPSYKRDWWRPDILAGLTAAAVVIPKAMAYATIAGLPLQVGLYTCFVPMLIYAFFGSSRVMSVSTTTTIAILTGAQLGVMVPDGDPGALITASVTLALMVGLILAAAAILRLGFVANFISEPVLTGFKAGIGIVVIVDQVPKLLGLHFDKGGFVHNLGQILGGLGHLSWATLAVGIGTIAGLVLCERFRPRWPAPLIVIGLMIAGAAFLGWESHGVELVGAIPDRSAFADFSGSFAGRSDVAGSCRHCADELCRNRGRQPRLHRRRRSTTAGQYRTVRNRCGQYRRLPAAAACRAAAAPRRPPSTAMPAPKP